jgi:ABC-type sugar transport system substrate-binding protein
MIPLRLWLYGAAAVVLLAGLGYVKHLHGKAAERDEYKAQAEAAESRALAIAESAVKAAAKERDTAAMLTAFRGDLATQRQSFNEALTRKPLVIKVPHVDPQTGATVTCDQRDPTLYRSLFNQAVTGVASP